VSSHGTVSSHGEGGGADSGTLGGGSTGAGSTGAGSGTLRAGSIGAGTTGSVRVSGMVGLSLFVPGFVPEFLPVGEAGEVVGAVGDRSIVLVGEGVEVGFRDEEGDGDGDGFEVGSEPNF